MTKRIELKTEWTHEKNEKLKMKPFRKRNFLAGLRHQRHSHTFLNS